MQEKNNYKKLSMFIYKYVYHLIETHLHSSFILQVLIIVLYNIILSIIYKPSYYTAYINKFTEYGGSWYNNIVDSC